MFCFILWKTPKLSVAEIYSLFPEVNFVEINEKFAIIDNISEEELRKKFNSIWWTIKICKIQEKIKDQKDFIKKWVNLIKQLENDWKISFGISSFWENIDNFRIWLDIKKLFKASDSRNIRLVNKDRNNLNSAVIRIEKLDTKNIELNYIKQEDTKYIATTILSQDIEEYSKRDWQKDRDMEVGMLPPKLAQIMINLAWPGWVYDPFCGLGTVLIEAINNWVTDITGSDISREMVKVTGRNIEDFLYDKNINNVNYRVFEQDASKISYNKSDVNIVTEWYLWHIFWQKSIYQERVEKERLSLIGIYEWFFARLKASRFKWNIVISFPFWDVKWRYIYFEEIYELLKKEKIKVHKLLPENEKFKETKSGSLLYKRDNQTVGREIFKLSVI